MQASNTTCWQTACHVRCPVSHFIFHGGGFLAPPVWGSPLSAAPDCTVNKFAATKVEVYLPVQCNVSKAYYFCGQQIHVLNKANNLRLWKDVTSIVIWREDKLGMVSRNRFSGSQSRFTWKINSVAIVWMLGKTTKHWVDQSRFEPTYHYLKCYRCSHLLSHHDSIQFNSISSLQFVRWPGQSLKVLRM